MSSTGRATSKGGKGTKPDKPAIKVDKIKLDGGKGGGEKALNKEPSSKTDELSIKDKVKTLIEMTQRSEEEVCLALHESNNNIEAAINILYEEMAPGEWETRDKKKKKRQASTSKPEKTDDAAAVDDWDNTGVPASNNNAGAGGDKERGRNSKRGGDGGPRRNDGNRGWRGRERQENERNFEDGGGGRGGDRRGRPGGQTRGGGGGRGRGGGRAGGRYPPRGDRRGDRPPRGDYNKQPIDTWDSSNTWDNNTAANVTNHNNADDWDDFPGADEWSTEEFSLVESKVFTPSVQPKMDVYNNETAQNSLDPNTVINQETTYSQQLSQSLQMAPQTVQMPAQSPVPPMVGTLTAAQSQYFSQLSQQNSDSLNSQYNSSYGNQAYDKANVQQVYNNTSSQLYSTTSTQPVYNSTSQPYNPEPYNAAASNTYVNNTYQPVNNAYGASPEGQAANQPARTKTQRARVPPPSKIPSSAVEMPGDLNSNMTYLDVQFGAMDLIDNSFDNTNQDAKYGSSAANTNSANVLDSQSGTPSAAGLDLGSNAANQNSAGLDAYAKSNAQNSISSSLTQSLQNNDSIPQTSEHLSYNSAASAREARSTAQTAGVAASVPPAAPSGLELGKSQPDTHAYNSQQATYNSYQSKTNSYGASPYNTAQTSATNSYGLNSQPTYVNNQSSAYNTSSSYPNTYSTAAYQSGANSAFPSISQPSSYQSTGGQSSYPQNTSQSVYGASTGLNSTFGSTAPAQYNSYNSSSASNLKNSYDTSSNAASSTQSTTSNSAVSTSNLALSQTTVSSTKTTASLAKSSSVVSNIPPGVTPVMSTPYIMGQVPYFQQPVYSYEEMQLLQQRLPHMTTPYYDMSYQTPTTLAAVRGDPTGALGGYSTMSADGRFTTGATARGDSNTSPVPSSTLTGAVQSQTSTLSAQQGHQAQPILAAGTAQPYFFATAFNTIAAPNYAQFGAMYTLPAATNAHGSSNSSQYPKPAAYGSASGYSHYDAMGQSTQDYAKSGFAVSNAAVAAAAQAQKVQGSNSTSAASTNDLSAMYGKTHAALGKVNSYDKQGFHSGTPPPFNAGLHGSQTAGLQNATGYPQVYIPTMAPQHHTTAMMHQPLHQMDVRHQGRRVDSGNSTGQRSQSSNQAKTGSKQQYQSSYWNQN